MSEINSAPIESSAPSEVKQETPQQDAPKQETPQPPQKRKYSYKADGQDHSEELSDEEIATKLSLAKAASKRMQEASSTKKQVEEFVKQLKEDPMSVLSDDRIMGSKKFRQIAEEFILKQIEEEQLTPEERLQIERERKLNEYERKEKEWQEQQNKTKAQQLEQQYAAEYEKTIIDSLSASNLPKTPYTVARMARLMQQNLQHGFDLTPQQLSTLVREDYDKELKSVIGGASAEQLIEMFGQEVADKIRKHDLAKFRATSKSPTPQPTKPQEPPARMSRREFEENLRNKFK